MSYCSPRLVAALAVVAASLAFCTQAAAQGQPQQAQQAPQFVQANPPWQVPLTNAEQARVEQIVNFWSFSSDQINTFECKFNRLDYSMAWQGNMDVAYSMAEGMIRYASPDKGEYRVDTLKFFVPNSNPVRYEAREGEVGEHWVCTGDAIYEFKPQQEVLLEMRLPPGMQGDAISDGPLPFLFGVEAAKLFDRYWIREIQPPQGHENVYWLEAYPKRQEDAANFSVATIIIDSSDFLPSAMQLVMPGGNEKKTFQFTDRKKNAIVANLMQNWLNNFIKPEAPRGWRTVTEEFGGGAAAPGGQPPAGDVPAARLPAAPQQGQDPNAQGGIPQQSRRPVSAAWLEE